MDYTGSAKVLIKIFKTVLTTNKKTSGRQVSVPTSLLGPVSIYRSISGSRRQPRAWCDLHLMTSQLSHTTYLRTRCSYTKNAPAVRNISCIPREKKPGWEYIQATSIERGVDGVFPMCARFQSGYRRKSLHYARIECAQIWPSDRT